MNGNNYYDNIYSFIFVFYAYFILYIHSIVVVCQVAVGQTDYTVYMSAYVSLLPAAALAFHFYISEVRYCGLRDFEKLLEQKAPIILL